MDKLAKKTNIKAWCPICDKQVSAILTLKDLTRTVNNKPVTVRSHVAVCPTCHATFSTAELETENLKLLKDTVARQS